MRIYNKTSKQRRALFSGSDKCVLAVKMVVFWGLLLCFNVRPSSARDVDHSVAAMQPPGLASNIFGEQRVTPQGFLPPLQPIMDIPMRDPHAMLGPDGYYYLTGTQPPDGDTDFWHPYNGIRVFRSPDLKRWENLGYVYTLKDNGTWQLSYQPGNLLPSFIPDHAHLKPTIWAPDIYYIKGTWWIAYAIAYNGWGTINGLLKSTSGLPTGPYSEVGTGPLTTEIDPGLFQDDDGKVYYVWNNGKFALMNEDMTALAEPPRTVAPCNADQVAFEGAALRQINGRYYMQAAGDGGHPRDYHGFSTYDTYVASSDNVHGPYGPNYVAIRNGGHNALFKGKDGQWWATFFGWNGINPFNEKPAILPIELDEYAHVRPYYNQFTILTPDGRVKGVNWNYSFTAPAEDWTKAGFDDSGWNSAEGGFGNNVVASAPVPVRTMWNGSDIWLRRHFALPKIGDAPFLVSLDIFNTGSAEVYINGVLAYSASQHQQYYTESHPLNPEAIKALVFGGNNTIAIHSSGREGRYIDAGLRLFTHKELVPLATAKPDANKSVLVDLGKNFAITRTDLYFKTPGIWHQYLIEYSSDQKNWRVFYDGRQRKAVGDPCYTDVFDNGISADHVVGRYLRVTATSSAQSDGVSPLEKFCVFGHTSDEDLDLARGKTVEASSADERYPARNAVDNYWGSKWRPHGELPQSLMVDLGKTQPVRVCKIWFGSEGIIYNYRIETSLDGRNWTLFADRSANTQPADPCYEDYAKTSARYVRLVLIGHNNSGSIDVLDFKVYGKTTSEPRVQPDALASVIGHWKLDETAGRMATDSNGHSEGLLKGDAVWARGRLNGALELRGGTMAVRHVGGDAFTILFWLKTVDHSAADTGKNGESFISSRDGKWDVHLMKSTLVLRIGARNVPASQPVNDGQWHHCAVSCAVDGTVRILIDGNSQVTTEVAPGLANLNSGLVFGGKAFNGVLDDIILFNRPLDETELASIGNPPPSLAGKWNFQTHSANESPDWSARGNNAQFFGRPTWSENGIAGGAVSFGDDQTYGEIKRPVQNDFTISFWIKTTQSNREASWNEGAWLINGEMPGDTGDFGASLSAGKFVFGTGAPDTSVASKTRVNDGRWHQCVATRQKATGLIRIFVDGQLERTVTAGRASLTAPPVLRLGGSGDHYFEGALSDLEIYDGALGNEEVRALFQKQLK